MNLFRESRYIMHLFLVILVCWLGWLCGLAFGQLDQAFTSSVNFPDIGITCIGNLAAFIVVILRSQIGIGQRPQKTLQDILGYKKLKKIKELEGLTTCREELWTCDVLMLSKQTPTYSMQSFMRYIPHSIFLQCRPLQSVEKVSVETCEGNHCGCIVFETVEEIAIMLSRRMPVTIKRLSDSLCLLPCLHCLRKGCHGCNTSLLHVEEIDENGRERLREGQCQVESPAAVCEILDLKSIHEVRTCIFIPLRSANDDEWTNALITFFKPDPQELRGAVIREGRTNASSALENYKNRRGECDAVEEYKLASLFIVPMLTIVFIQIVLTFWFKVDGFSSYVFAEKALTNYFPRQFPPHEFLTKAHVKSNANNTSVCQVLFFRGDLQILALFEIFVTTICSITWIVRVAVEGGPHKWYHIHSIPPSKPRIVLILVGICIALLMDAFDFKLYLKIRRMPSFRRNNDRISTFMICVSIVLEILCIVGCSAIGGVLGLKAFERWVYGALQVLVWIKAGIGYLVYCQLGYRPKHGEPNWWYGLCGMYIFSSSFLLNAILAGVRSKWEF